MWPLLRYVAPAEGDYQAYADEYGEPVPAVEESIVDPSTQQVLKLPSTGAGYSGSMPLGSRRGNRGPGARRRKSEATSARLADAGSTDEASGPVTRLARSHWWSNRQ